MPTNYEHFDNEIKTTILLKGLSCNFIIKNILSESECRKIDCDKCNAIVRKWLDEEYVQRVDWSKVPVDSKVVCTKSNGETFRRYFCKFENDTVYTFDKGATSWSALYDFTISGWDPKAVELIEEAKPLI